MPVAAVLLVAGITTRSPTAVGGDAVLDDPRTVRGILTITRHPFLNATGLWALAHLAANGDLASILLFGALALLSYAGMAALDGKLRRRMAAAWGPVAMTTSRTPLLAALRSEEHTSELQSLMR